MASATRSAPPTYPEAPSPPLPRTTSHVSAPARNARMPLTRRTKSAFPLSATPPHPSAAPAVTDTSPLHVSPLPASPSGDLPIVATPAHLQPAARHILASRSSSALVTPRHVRRPSRLSSSTDLPELVALARAGSVTIPVGTPDATAASRRASVPSHARTASKERLTASYVTGAVGSAVESLLRANKSTQKFVADRKVAMKHKTRKVHPDLVKGVVLLFVVLFAILFIILKWLFGASAVTDVTSLHKSPHEVNLRRVRDGRAPEEYWPRPGSQAQAMQFSPSLSKVTLEQLRQVRTTPKRRALFRPARQAIAPAGAKVRVSIIAACRDRTGFLQTALPGWLDAIGDEDEVVLVDWGTRAPDHVPLKTVVEDLDDERLSVTSVDDPGSWVLSRAYNLALALVRGEWLLKLDCDTMVDEDMFASLQLPPAPSSASFADRVDSTRYFYRYFWEHARDENEQHLNGVLLARTEDVRRVYGYDERIVTYGWDDTDLYSRLESDGAASGVGLKARDFAPGSVSHIKHADTFRGANQRLVVGPTLETQVNSQAVSELRPWTVVAPQEKTEYEFEVLTKDGRFSSARILRAPLPVLEQIPRGEHKRIVEEAKNRLLHDIYGFPWSVLSEINRSRDELVRSLAILGRSTHWRSANGFIFAEVGGTVPERLLGMASAVSLAMAYERPLFLAWSSGSREEPTPRVTDFFDVDSSGIVDDGLTGHLKSSSNGARVYQVGRWKCRFSVEVCAQSDPAFNFMTEFRTGGHTDEAAAAQAVLDVLQGRMSGKRNVLLRLEGAFPMQKQSDRALAMASLTPSHSLADHISQFGDLSEYLGVYVGAGVRPKGLEAMARRLESHNAESTKYFVSGAERETVVEARKALQSPSERGSVGSDSIEHGPTEEISDTVRDIAELYVLASCKDMVNDGRPPAAVLEVTSLLKQGANRRT